MSMFDEARSIAVMMKMRGLSQGQVAKMLGASQSYVANKLRLLQLDHPLQVRITAEYLSERHARALLRLDEKLRPEALDKICKRHLTVAESEALIDSMRNTCLPNKIGRAARLSGIDIFLNGVKASLSSLSAIGVSASQKISYHGSKIMVTILLDEG